MEPRYNKGPREWQNLFAISRFRFIKVLFHAFYYCWGKENRSFYEGLRYIEVRYIEVPLYFKHSSKKKIFPASLHSKAFILLCKFETSWALLGRLSRGFCAISGASNFKQLFMTLSGVGVLLCESFLVESPNL